MACEGIWRIWMRNCWSWPLPVRPAVPSSESYSKRSDRFPAEIEESLLQGICDSRNSHPIRPFLAGLPIPDPCPARSRFLTGALAARPAPRTVTETAHRNDECKPRMDGPWTLARRRTCMCTSRRRAGHGSWREAVARAAATRRREGDKGDRFSVRSAGLGERRSSSTHCTAALIGTDIGEGDVGPCRKKKHYSIAILPAGR
ncbi:hypothetical protein SETIT_5G127900v2 [Setaria italica]|uniref:Uncharacterized protein n=1 Tax=Setaria italica TaxID=4555 RepID=A0A368R4E0_SETIT|nr:hypothetical protein SETIT_5G127900v2 [Setaria italica]